MQAGVTYNQQKLHHAGYFKELMPNNPDIDESLRRLLHQCREALVRLRKTEGALVRSLQQDPFLAERVERLAGFIRPMPGKLVYFIPGKQRYDGQ